MAGSLNHIVGDEGFFSMDLIENLDDAHEALHECFNIIQELTGGKKSKVNAVMRKLNFPEIECNMKHTERDW